MSTWIATCGAVQVWKESNNSRSDTTTRSTGRIRRYLTVRLPFIPADAWPGTVQI
jgi:hypothetical protein